MSICLGLDLGEKRVGVAISDESGFLATPLTALSFHSRNQLIENLRQLVEEYRVSKMIVGLPQTLKGENGSAAQRVIAHVEWFKSHLDRPWVLWDERLSTREIERILIAADVSRGKRKEVRDKLAAQRILQSYLDYERNTK